MFSGGKSKRLLIINIFTIFSKIVGIIGHTSFKILKINN